MWTPELLGFHKSNKAVVFFAVVCPPGSHFQKDECIPCPFGYYQHQTGRSSCIKCPVGKTTNSYGAFSADHCKLNSFLPLPFVFWLQITNGFFLSSVSFLKKRIFPLGFFLDGYDLFCIHSKMFYKDRKSSGVLTKNAWEMSGQSHPGCCGSLRCVRWPQEWYLGIQYQWETSDVVHLMSLSWTLKRCCLCAAPSPANTNTSHKTIIDMFTEVGVFSLNDLFLHAVL